MTAASVVVVVPERFVCLGAKKRYINTLPFLFLSSSTSISMLQRIRGVMIVLYKSTFYLLT